MKISILKQVFLALVWSTVVVQVNAQGVVINKTDGSKIYYKASDVQSIRVYGYDTDLAAEYETITVNGVSFNMIFVYGGTFKMGSNSGDDDEKPVHTVTLNSYYIGETEVTQALWKAVMGTNPSKKIGDNQPVEQVSWNDCQSFIKKINTLTGRTFRLPTEAEWEFAARGGMMSHNYTYSGSDNIDDVAWFNMYSPQEVKTKAPNELGIYDMSGNVWEWCQDYYANYESVAQINPTGPDTGDKRVFRGGHNSPSYPSICRVSQRSNNSPSTRSDRIGFRIVL